jgi:hypothetical protein
MPKLLTLAPHFDRALFTLLEFIVDLIQALTLYSIIGTAVNGRMILWGEGARRRPRVNEPLSSTIV